MSPLLKIRSERDQMSAIERRIADFLLENSHLLRDYSSQQLANALGISQSSVVKFSQKLGFKGYPDLKYSIGQAVARGDGADDGGTSRETRADDPHAALAEDLWHLKALAEKSFGLWQQGTPARPALITPSAIPPRVVIVDKPGSPQTQLRVATIGAARSSPDFRPLQVMNIALGGLFSSRINMNLREQHGYTYGASSQFTFRRAAGPFQVGSGVRTDVTGPSVSEIFKELRGMVEKPMDQAELQRAKNLVVLVDPVAEWQSVTDSPQPQQKPRRHNEPEQRSCIAIRQKRNLHRVAASRLPDASMRA